MNRSICIVSVFCFIAAGILSAQTDIPRPARQEGNRSQRSEGSIQADDAAMIPGLRRRALVLDINARVLEDTQNVIWNETHQKLTISGNPVGIQLVGSNVVVSVQFTPYIRRQGGSVLVAQGQIWFNDPNNGVSYFTSIQTIPMEFNEPIYFFPLGTSEQLKSSIEIILTVNPFRENAEIEAAANTDNDH